MAGNILDKVQQGGGGGEWWRVDIMK